MNLHRLVKDNTGLDLPDATLERALRERMGACGAHAREDYAPLPGTPEFEALLELVVVPESWMFRDPAVFDAALRFVRRRLLARPGARVRILCLPCAGGEEAYSMAMRLHDAGIAPARCRIDAVDLSQAAIAQARQGRYTRNAFRGADLAFRARWFTQEDDSWLIRPELRDYIGFRQGNLFAMDADAHRAYDLVFCRNLLIYFDADGQRRGTRAVDALLASDGMLLSGYAEAPAFCSHGFVPAPGYGVFALQRQARAPGRAARMRAMRVSVPVRARVYHAPPASAPASAPAPASSDAVPVHASPAPQDLLAQAQRHADAGALPDAEAHCRQLLAAHPEHADAWFLLGLVHDCGGEVFAAERCWRRCLYLQPEHYEAMCSLALLHERRGEAMRAASLRRRAGRLFQRHTGTPA